MSDEPLDLSRSAIEEQADTCFAEADFHNHRSGRMLLALEAKLREAVEVMRELADRWEILCDVIKPLINDDAYVAARAFLASIKRSDPVAPPAVAPLRDDPEV